LVFHSSSITYSECVSEALVIQHEMGMFLITFSSGVCLAHHIFFHVISSTARF